MQPYLAQIAICLAIAPLLGAARGEGQPEALLVGRSPMALRASSVTYDGVRPGSMPAQRFESERKRENWVEVKAGDTIFFPSRLTSSDGLGSYRIATETWTKYPMFQLAIAAGWYEPLPGERSFPEDIHGLAVGGGRVWVGTQGLGIVAREIRDGKWSRYDVKAGVLPGIHSMVFHADDEYVLGYSGGPTGGWQKRLPDVRESDLGPALEVYSLRRNAWLRVLGIPRGNVIQFGWTASNRVSVQCDTRRFDTRAVMPLELCTRPRHAQPAPSGDGYVLGADFPEPGVALRYTIRKDQLEAAFASLGKM